ncbi:hypothetical protein [Vulgatibacter incomptus]|uniref:Uncharacterized protein n=1 Tax=Vulgatibacter incomptus TaxID=1391653 RepID=A0A0K1PB87_9BACT|nr:hypothetical protein [Vulgatibacter incomptus]AKU90785.1 hypothetical protein AKJ08_1172 [Vulgatibacter incomptus]
MTRVVAAAVAVWLSSTGCITGMARVGAEALRSGDHDVDRIVDRKGDWVTIETSRENRENRFGLVLGANLGPSIVEHPEGSAKVAMGGSVYTQAMVGFDDGYALGLGVGYSNSKGDRDGEIASQSGWFFDVRGSLALSDELAVHAGVGPFWSSYSITADGEDTPRFESESASVGLRGVAGLTLIFLTLDESSFGLRLEASHAIGSKLDYAGKSFVPTASQAGLQLIWLSM